MRKGPVSSRVALLLRSAEGKPFFASISHVFPSSKVDKRKIFFSAGFFLSILHYRVIPTRDVTRDILIGIYGVSYTG